MKKLHDERGQTVVEFSLIATVLFMLTVGLIDVGRAFYEYNVISAAARYGSRWGGVVGGTCLDPGSTSYAAPSKSLTSSTQDWCVQEGSPNTSGGSLPITGGGFWTLNGNRQLQASGQACPTDPSSNPSALYTAANFSASTDTSIVGVVVHRFDTTSTSSNTSPGQSTPGFDLNKLKVCIQLPTSGEWHGEAVTVFVYYPFTPAGPLFGNVTMNLYASAQYVIE